MEIAYILNELWRRRIWLAVGLVFATLVAASTVYSFPSMEKKTLQIGAASTELLVDASSSPIGSIDAPLDALIVRTSLYPRLLASSEVKGRIADKMGIAPGRISTVGPQPIGNQQATRGREATADQRANELLAEGNIYRLVAQPAINNPVLVVTGQAATAEEAILLVETASEVLRNFVSQIQERQQIHPAERVEIRQLGGVSGGIVNEGVDKAAAIMAWIAAFVAWCVLVLVVGRVMTGLRQARVEEQPLWQVEPRLDFSPHSEADSPVANGSGNGARDDLRVTTPR